MLVASLDDSYGYEKDEQSTTVSIMEIPSGTSALDTLDDVILLPNMAAPVTPTVIASNHNLLHNVYAMCELPKPCAFVASGDFEHTAYLSLGGKFNSCLDSGCMDYIITNCALFQNYDTEGDVNIGTANCGLLSAKGSGDVTFQVPFED